MHINSRMSYRGGRARVRFERRERPRYPIALALNVRGLEEKGRTGHGKSINISSAGILFRSTSHLLAGDHATVTAEWPVTCDGEPLVLVMQGQIIWTKGSTTAMSITRHSLVPASTITKACHKQELQTDEETPVPTADTTH
jgi:hypothetical protein